MSTTLMQAVVDLAKDPVTAGTLARSTTLMQAVVDLAKDPVTAGPLARSTTLMVDADLEASLSSAHYFGCIVLIAFSDLLRRVGMSPFDQRSICIPNRPFVHPLSLGEFTSGLFHSIFMPPNPLGMLRVLAIFSDGLLLAVGVPPRK
jgi:hypothetical protein